MSEFYLADNPQAVAQYTYPRRGGSKLSGTCIVHTAEGYGAESVAQFITRRTDYGSYHRLVDPNVIIKMAHWEWETWQDSETNNWAVGISAACRAADWLGIQPAIRNKFYRNLAIAGAEFVMYMRVAYGIEVPRRRLTGAEARSRVPGFCAHGDSGLNRSDPGVNFDWDLFFTYIDQELDGKTEEDIMAFTISELLNAPAYDGGPSVSQVLKNVDERSKANFDANFNGGDSMPEGKPIKDLIHDGTSAVRNDIAELAKKIK